MVVKEVTCPKCAKEKVSSMMFSVRSSNPGEFLLCQKCGFTDDIVVDEKPSKTGIIIHHKGTYALEYDTNLFKKS